MKNITFLFFLLPTLLFSQSKHYKYIKHFNSYELDSVNILLKSTTNTLTDSIFKLEYDYLKRGSIKRKEMLLKCNYQDSVLYFNHLGNYFIRKKKLDLIFKNFKKALEISKNHKDSILINNTLININMYLLINDRDTLTYKKYVKELINYKKSKIDFFWAEFFDIVYNYTNVFTKKNIPIIEKRYLNLLKTAPENPFLKGYLKNMLAIFYENTNRNKLAKKYYKETILNYQKDDFYLNYRKIRTKINLEKCYFFDKKYKKVIKNLVLLSQDKMAQNDLEIKYILYDWIYKSYKELGDSVKMFKYYEKSRQAYDGLTYFQSATKNREIDKKYDVKEKDKIIKSVSTENDSLNQKIKTILPILIITTILLAIFFILYKKHQKKSSTLEEEKSETIKKIDELKQIVIKNHIVLKDKTKVYIADLLYIKSDDHYLKVYLSNGKNHFVRGRLNKIIEELPPNFIRCHRSYVVNRNFIKQINNNNIILVDKTEIPLSRTYKDRL